MQAPARARGKKTPDPVDVLVGHRIRMYRMIRGMSQSQLATELGLTFQQVQKYEKGANRVGAGRLIRIAQALQIPVQTLFGDDVSNDQKLLSEPSPVDWISEPGAVRLLQAYARVREPDVRRAIVSFIEQMTPKS